MTPVQLLLQSAVRYFIGLVLTWCIAKGWFTADLASKALPSISEGAFLALSFAALIAWSYAQKLINGWTKKYPDIFEIPFRKFPASKPVPQVDPIDS